MNRDDILAMLRSIKETGNFEPTLPGVTGPLPTPPKDVMIRNRIAKPGGLFDAVLGVARQIDERNQERERSQPQLRIRPNLFRPQPIRSLESFGGLGGPLF